MSLAWPGAVLFPAAVLAALRAISASRLRCDLSGLQMPRASLPGIHSTHGTFITAESRLNTYGSSQRMGMRSEKTRNNAHAHTTLR